MIVLTFTTHFFQELEQEKYHLRRRLEIAEEEFDQVTFQFFCVDVI
jgi:hypothetical protein